MESAKSRTQRGEFSDCESINAVAAKRTKLFAGFIAGSIVFPFLSSSAPANIRVQYGNVSVICLPPKIVHTCCVTVIVCHYVRAIEAPIIGH